MLRKSFSHIPLEAGCDEAGRGCLCGPVFAAAVILPEHFSNDFLKDSKKLTKKQRNELRNIIEKEAITWAVGSVDNETIDKINILNASITAMHRALDGLNMKPQFIIVDGNKFTPYHGISFHCIIKGDNLYESIAAASVLAKTHRDEFMEKIHQEFPQYGWSQNKGYPTSKHRQAIRNFGITSYHRLSYNLNEQLRLKF